MEFQKIANFLDTTPDDNDLLRFVTKNGLKSMINQKKITTLPKIRIKTSMLRWDLCDFSDAYIAVEGNITLECDNDANKRNKNLAFKNNASFINWIWKINGVQNAEDLDVVMPMYNLHEYSKNYKKNNRQFVKLLQR